MRMIYIPPLQMLEHTGTSPRQLMLPHMVWNETYARHFQKAKRTGMYNILDNGANEGQECAPSKLAAMCYTYGIDELVLPDIMGNAEATYERALEFFSDYRLKVPVQTKFGFVLHGHDADDTIKTYEALKKNRVLFERLNVLYVPRRLIHPHQLSARMQVAQHILEDRDTKAIHFLGASPYFLREVEMLSIHGVRVRSMDTSAPFVYAMKGELVSPEPLKAIGRDIDTYFGTAMTDDMKRLAILNMEAMDEWAKAPVSRM